MNTKETKENRKTTARGVSLRKEINEAVDARIAELQPWINGFSDYVQALIRIDLESSGA